MVGARASLELKRGKRPPRASPSVVTGVLDAALAVIPAAVIAAAFAAPLRAADEAHGVDLRASDAPLSSALEHLAGLDGQEVRVSDDIRDRISGRLTGRADELLELLVDTHGLSVYTDADTVWFDREERRVVDFVRLDPELVESALDALTRPAGIGGTAVRDASGKGIVLSGTRAYVETSLERVLLATASGESDGPAAGRPDAGGSTAVDSDAAAFVVGDVPAGGADASGRGGEAGESIAIPNAPVETRVSLGQARAAELLGARIALVSTEAPRSVVLDDGTRLAPGESLPSGHRIVAIERERIVTERDGGLTIVALPEPD